MMGIGEIWREGDRMDAVYWERLMEAARGWKQEGRRVALAAMSDGSMKGRGFAAKASYGWTYYGVLVGGERLSGAELRALPGAKCVAAWEHGRGYWYELEGLPEGEGWWMGTRGCYPQPGRKRRGCWQR